MNTELPVFFRTVLVLGADSEPGLSIVEALLAEGHKVVAWTRPESLAQPWDEEMVRVICAPLPAPTEPLPELPRCDVLVLANALEDGDGPPEALWRIAEERYRVAERVLSACGADRFVLLSNIEVAGPLTPAEGERFEAQEPRPAEHSGGALLAVEHHSMYLARERQVGLVILRAGHIYGHGNPGVFSQAMLLLQSEDVELLQREWPNHRYQPVHLADLAQAVTRAVQRGNGIYHIMGNEIPTVGELMRVLERVARARGIALTALKAPLFATPSSERMHYRFPVERARAELGYAPRWSLEAGLLEVAGRTKVEMQFAAHRTTAISAQLMEDWSEDEGLSRMLHAPVRRFLGNAVRRHRVRRVLDLGCGDGRHSLWMASALDVQVQGVDPAWELVVRANAAATAADVNARASYTVGDLASVNVSTPVDAVCLFGALEEHPLLLAELGFILKRVLKPDGVVLIVGPHCIEGYHPKLSRVMHAFFTSWMRRFFDERAYRRSIARERTRGFSETRRDGSVSSRRTSTVEHAATPLDERYAHFLAPFIANAFVTFQRAALVRGLMRCVMPLCVRVDGWLCRFPLPRSWAALSMRSYTAAELTAPSTKLTRSV
ncbi:MAG: methyltransferase domain-containing protein [Planctomycetes bacterium]|nr:methyltransferase domain-containing protein [Planctomycetota bacterium]